MKDRWRRLGASLLLCAVLAPGVARADDVDRCVAASERGQDAQRRKMFRDARAAFAECSSDRCPAAIRSACTEWLAEVAQKQPSIVVVVKSPEGADVPQAALSIDGRSVGQGISVPLEPGVHKIDVTADGFDDASMPIVAREGERDRAVRLTLAPRKTEKKHEGSGVRPITWVTGGLAVGALGGFLYLGITGAQYADELRRACGPTCPTEERDTLQRRYIVADLMLVAAVVLGGVSLYTLLSGDTAKTATR